MNLNKKKILWDWQIKDDTIDKKQASLIIIIIIQKICYVIFYYYYLQIVVVNKWMNVMSENERKKNIKRKSR